MLPDFDTNKCKPPCDLMDGWMSAKLSFKSNFTIINFRLARTDFLGDNKDLWLHLVDKLDPATTVDRLKMIQ